jgi:hypothetical protein
VKRSGDLVIGRSGDRIVSLEAPNHNLTTEARRHGVGNWENAGTTRHCVSWLFRGCQLFVGVLREIFDESAYDRFLVRTQAVRSVESYREFLREREGAAARRPRCC